MESYANRSIYTHAIMQTEIYTHLIIQTKHQPTCDYTKHNVEHMQLHRQTLTNMQLYRHNY